ncbi:MAG: cupin domain-containing protein [Gammaproteobacteria bacterium]|nr:cupin domain-containing protein [Gammaproteobacteria bacterium]
MHREDLIRRGDARVAAIALEAGEASPWHYHSRVTETVFGLQGEVRLETGAGTAAVTLLPGQRHTLAPGVVHRLSNPGGTKSVYLLVQNGHYDFVAVDP